MMKPLIEQRLMRKCFQEEIRAESGVKFWELHLVGGLLAPQLLCRDRSSNQVPNSEIALVVIKLWVQILECPQVISISSSSRVNHDYVC